MVEYVDVSVFFFFSSAENPVVLGSVLWNAIPLAPYLLLFCNIKM